MALYRQRAGLPAAARSRSAAGTATGTTSPATSPGTTSRPSASCGRPPATRGSRSARTTSSRSSRRSRTSTATASCWRRPGRASASTGSSRETSAPRPSTSTASGCRGTCSTRRWPACATPTATPGTATALDVSVKAATWTEGIALEARRRADADDARHRVRRHAGGAGRPLRRHRRRALARPLPPLRPPRRPRSAASASEDRLSGLHGNTNIPKLVAAAARYGYAGDEGDLSGGRLLLGARGRHHTFATGGHSKDEHLRDPDRYGAIVDGRTAESCNVYNMLKLTRRLFALPPGRRLRGVPGARALQPRAGLDRSRGRRDLLHGARGPRRAARVRRHGDELHVLRGHGDGEPRAARARDLPRVRRHALGEPLRAVARGVGGRAGASSRRRRTSRRASRRASRSPCRRRGGSRWPCAGPAWAGGGLRGARSTART